MSIKEISKTIILSLRRNRISAELIDDVLFNYWLLKFENYIKKVFECEKFIVRSNTSRLAFNIKYLSIAVNINTDEEMFKTLLKMKETENVLLKYMDIKISDAKKSMKYTKEIKSFLTKTLMRDKKNRIEYWKRIEQIINNYNIEYCW